MNRLANATLCLVVALAVAAPAMADRSRRDYKDHRGYREHPYDKHRRYDHRDYRDKRYTYEGHWRSWDAWDPYYRANPWLHRHGHYYREEGHLMFRFCDPDGGGCFFFSIGR